MRAYLQLLRLPTVFTAWSDILLGYFLTHATAEDWPKLVLLLISTSGLYLSGMVFNDVFDVAEDTCDRPQRPIPSGRITRRTAIILGVILMGVGVAAAFAVASQSRLIALLLVAAILGYNGFLKQTPIGPVSMGLCRFLNVMLGASDFSWSEASLFWGPPQLPIAFGMGIYIVGVTIFAKSEATTSPRGSLLAGLGAMDVGLIALAGWMASHPGLGRLDFSLMVLTVIAVSLNLRAFRAVADPSPGRVQGLIKLFLLNLVTMAAAVLYWHTGDSVLTLLTACLVIPPMLISKMISMT
ncbi:hypothetical protein GC163_21765 [bacterium]|nr:hypothetical protein [bacterium]